MICRPDPLVDLQTFFMNVVDALAKEFGVSSEDIKQNLTKSEANAFGMSEYD